MWFGGRQHSGRLGDILSQRQIVPATKCPISSPATKCPTEDPTENHCFSGIFWATICPKVTKCPTFSPATNCPNLCTYAHESYGKLSGDFVASEKGYWDNLSQVKNGQSWAYLGGYFSVRRHYNITVCYKNIRGRQGGQFVAIEKGNKY